VTLFKALRRPEWSPYTCGIGLGVVVTISMAVFGHRLSGAGAYQHLAGYAGRAVAPASVFFTRVLPVGLTWDILVAVGALLGALVSALLSRSFRWRALPDSQWTESFGSRVSVRWAVAFVGSMLTELGGGIAGGCTASLAVSGGAALVPAAFLFMIGMFAGGIPVAVLVLHRRGRRAGVQR